MLPFYQITNTDNSEIVGFSQITPDQQMIRRLGVRLIFENPGNYIVRIRMNFNSNWEHFLTLQDFLNAVSR